MSGWYQLGTEYKDSWEFLTNMAFDIIHQDNMITKTYTEFFKELNENNK